MKQVRLQKYIAQCGIASRRGAEKLITEGRIKVNEILADKLGTQVDPELDTVTYNDEEITPILENSYFALNKPKEYITTKKDTHDRATIYDLIPENLQHLVPAGRLDKDTTGLLLLSNDGEFIYQITHPKFELKKEYIVTCRGKITPDEITQLKNGVLIEGKRTFPAKINKVEIFPHKSTMHITIHEGRKRQIRMMFRAVERHVLALQRIRINTVTLNNLKEGSIRKLTAEEVDSLKTNQSPN